MSIFQPATPYSESIERPACDKCGTKMQLAMIEPDGLLLIGAVFAVLHAHTNSQ